MLTERVTRYLLDRGAITAAQAEEARRTQSFFGGQFESHLLKLGFVDEETLGDALTEAYGVPFASGVHLRAIPQAVLESLSLEIARRHHVCPFRIEDRRLRVAMLNPRDMRALAEIETASGKKVEPWITSEFRLYQALEKHYRLRMEGIRSISLAPPSARPPAISEAADPRDAAPAGKKVELGLDGRPLDDEIGAHEEAYFPLRTDPDPEPERTAPEPPPSSSAERTAVRREPVAGGDPLERLDAALRTAENRDEIAEAILDLCSTRSARAALFAVGREGLRGLAGRGRGFETERVKKVTVAPDASTLFDAVLRSRDFYFGVVPPLPANLDLYTVLGGKLPAMALVMPVQVKERTAVLLYLDDDERPMTRPDIPLMRRVGAKAGLAFEILLLRNKLREI